MGAAVCGPPWDCRGGDCCVRTDTGIAGAEASADRHGIAEVGAAECGSPPM
ncbi:hypothetical protein HQN87_06910 [Paenibacillus tritici]|uniref:Uncharacterized protein n=1 Tax=Paenibacillus tritici TaxID=1873425 RepID=A0ABX2DKB0_9BACL|nr:hypothetical protein [Paenibacillus tritici]NQX45056.1 hypothetical protein [Paenibacillus tritici]